MAFFNEDEKIIQIGDPKEEDGTGSVRKVSNPYKPDFEDTNAWGATESANWNANSGKVIPADAVQAGSLGMNVASFAVPANPKTTSATVLKKQTDFRRITEVLLYSNIKSFRENIQCCKCYGDNNGVAWDR